MFFFSVSGKQFGPPHNSLQPHSFFILYIYLGKVFKPNLPEFYGCLDVFRPSNDKSLLFKLKLTGPLRVNAT